MYLKNINGDFRMKKILIALMLLLLSVFTLIACGAGGGEGKTPEYTVAVLPVGV